MSASPSPSKGRKPRKPFAPKWLVLTHRYLGVSLGLLMLVWFASGVGMLFIHWPKVTSEERAAGLPLMTWAQYRQAPADTPLSAGDLIEDLAGRPILRSGGEVFDLVTGRPLDGVSGEEARWIAAAYARAHGLTARPAEVIAVERDQWTVTGYFNKRRPFWRVRFDDPLASDIYVSQGDGEVSQHTDRAQRVLNWLGPIPHWLYPQVLRQDARLWTQVVIWTSLAGVFLIAIGIYLGLVAWRPWRDERLTPFRGMMRWHHLFGLGAGVLTLTWTASGLLSMQPFGLLDSAPDPRAQAYRAAQEARVEAGPVLAALKAAAPKARQVIVAPFQGEAYLMVDGVRHDAAMRPAALPPSDLAAAAKRLGGEQGLLTVEDAYWYGHHEPARLPVWRVIAADGTRYYLDPATGELLRSFGASARSYRWLHLGLHRLDFIRGFDRGGGWAAAMTALLGVCLVGIGAGVVLAWRRTRHDLGQLGRRLGQFGRARRRA
ncbi:hypothetical protein [Phenylobacterium sp.]|uniref:hypothetical protein n=1 Tax=Phenylobacterium sp. TaxID=1871053 RepID=UPI0035B39204